MNKKQILGTILAGLVTINSLGGCTNKNAGVSSSSSTDTSIENVEEKYNKTSKNNYFIYRYPKYNIFEISSDCEDLEELIKNSKVVEINGRYYIVSQLQNNISYKTITDEKLAKEIFENYITALNTLIEEVEFQGYKITSMNLSNYINDKGEILYSLPQGFDLEQDNIVYKVEEEKNTIINAAIHYQEDGTKVYYAPNGGIVSGDKVISKSYQLVEKTLAEEVINNYLENNTLKLQK